MNQRFPWILSAKYLTAGVGSVMGILSAAMASFAMRELRENVSAHAPDENSYRSVANY